ncbi:PIG-L family deacetylase [Virgibacillus senegalensis]|uniref:PIG-L family deacetylase n=1 Tax=Virgibacillus senegalensis TaxID=1499679 RepID=UPI000A4A153E|nr:PIG-L family deacetylase [Virgibacillus senegalensis]
MIRKWSYVLLCLALFLPSFIPSQVFGESTDDEHNQDLWSAVKPLSTITSFMNTGAHPDDERSHLLAYLSRGLGVHTASIIANRGEGGQNEIGEELGNGLGIIRSREMIEASKITGVQVFHLSETTNDDIYDFGFSKSPDETLTKWGEETTYERFIKRIRMYQPDIVMPSFRDVESQHGHHRAIAQLSMKAFEDAADPAVFPEHMEEGLHPWQIKKLYLPASEDNATVGIEVGDYDPVYGMTYPQLGEQSRYLHKSQGMGRDMEPGSQIEYLELVKSSVGEIPDQESSIFEGLNYDFDAYSSSLKKSDNHIKGDLRKLQQTLDEVIDAYPNDEQVLETVHQALKQLHKTKQKVVRSTFKQLNKNDLLHRLDVKEGQLQQASLVASQLEVTTAIDNPVLVQGAEATITITLQNNGTKTLDNLSPTLSVPKDWEINGEDSPFALQPEEEKIVTFSVTAPEDAGYYQPYEEPIIQTNVSYQVNDVTSTISLNPEETIALLPEVGLKAEPDTLAINTAQPREAVDVDVTVTNYTQHPLETEISLQLPEEWNPAASKKVSFEEEESEKTVTFSIVPPEDLTDEPFVITPTAEVNGKQLQKQVQEIAYGHIGTFYHIQSADLNGIALHLDFPQNLQVGYIDSGFDLVAEKLSEVGMNITKIEDVATEDLTKYDTVVTGIRAYLSRDDLAEQNDKLLAYAENGGHVVVQYHKPGDNWNPDTTAPYPLTIGSPSIEWRVTDEASDYTILQPEHPLFNQPNQITEQDWEGWIQERGLYFPMEWDDNYETFLTMTDLDGDQFESGILLTDYGEGTYLYTNLVWYRQIQNLVPGGYRIFTNLISYDGSEE